MKKIFTTIVLFASALSLSVGQTNYIPNVTVSTFAGSATSGNVNGQGTAARFYYTCGIATDASGNIYVADTYNHAIRKITSSGLVSTIAGSGSSGTTEGQGTAAKFFYPRGLAVDASGNIYVADTYNHKIRKITSTGLVSTFAGTGLRGSDDGSGADASFSGPTGIAIDGSGNILVADQSNNLIRKITPSGVVSTFAGSGTAGTADGQGVTAEFFFPYGIAADKSGNIFVTDNGSHKVRKITVGGLVSTFAGSGTQGDKDAQGVAASFNGPAGVATDAGGNLFVADESNRKIRSISSTGLVKTLAGSGVQGAADGAGSVAEFSIPRGVAIDGLGNIYIADYSNNTIRKIVGGTITAIEHETVASFVDFYPNPAKDVLHIVLPEGGSGSVVLTDLQGNVVLSHSVNTETLSLVTSDLANGVYLLKLISGKNNYTRKVVISE